MIEISSVSKFYGNTAALDGLTMQLRRGIVTGVVGPNGAGKSTLMRMLAGEELPDAGSFRLDGSPWRPAAQPRVGIVHQDPALWPNLTVGENLLVGRERTRLARPRSGLREQEILQKLAIGDLVGRRLGELSLAIQQRVEIARALARDADVFLFDEPNSALTAAESEYLFERMRALAADGKVVLLVSHRLDEVARNCEEIFVVRGGKSVRGSAHGMSARELAEILAEGSSSTGRRSAPEGAPTAGEGLAVDGWVGDAFAITHLAARAGEVTAIVGVEGSGSRQFLLSLAGLLPSRGTKTLGGWQVSASARGKTLYLAGDRRETVFAHLSVAENLVMRSPPRSLLRLGALVSRGRVWQRAEKMRRQHGIKCRSVSDPASTLSGGNQQKVVVASAIAAQPDVLLVEEPTRGVDIASRREIYEQLRGFARQGRVVVTLCTEEAEVFELADRAIVIDRGAVVDELLPYRYASVEELAGAVAGAIGDARQRQRLSGG